MSDLTWPTEPPPDRRFETRQWTHEEIRNARLRSNADVTAAILEDADLTWPPRGGSKA